TIESSRGRRAQSAGCAEARRHCAAAREVPAAPANRLGPGAQEKIVANCCTGRVYVVLLMRGALSRLAPGERSTLEIGSCLVLSVLGLGLQLGQWPAWSGLVAAAGCLTWVVPASWVSGQARHLADGRGGPAPAH